MKKVDFGSDNLFILLSGIYIISRSFIDMSSITDIAVGACLILMAIKHYIIGMKK